MAEPQVIFLYEYKDAAESHLGKMWHEAPSKEGNKSHKYINAKELKDFLERKKLEIDADGDFLLGYISAIIDVIEKVQ